MSIVAQTLPTTAPAASPSTVSILLLTLLLAAVAVGFSAAVGVFRRRSIHGPVRLGPADRIGPIFMITFVGAVTWFGVQMAYLFNCEAAWRRTNPNTTFQLSALTPADFATMATLPAIIGLGVLIVGDVLAKQDLPAKLGYHLKQLPRGVIAGGIGAVIVLLLMLAGELALEFLYRAVHYEHPTEHELLTAMKGAPEHVKVILIVSAVLVAPVFEEFLFRGHVQTLLVRLFTERPNVMVPVIPDYPPGAALPYESPPPAPVMVLPQDPPKRLTWLAVLITSMIFAAVHPAWTAPLIFVLSVCLGYAYERTGSLWTPILIHAAFNASSTVVFLTQR